MRADLTVYLLKQKTKNNSAALSFPNFSNHSFFVTYSIFCVTKLIQLHGLYVSMFFLAQHKSDLNLLSSFN